MFYPSIDLHLTYNINNKLQFTWFRLGTGVTFISAKVTKDLTGVEKSKSSYYWGSHIAWDLVYMLSDSLSSQLFLSYHSPDIEKFLDDNYIQFGIILNYHL